MVIASAPGKVILFGEHAVVYGKPAIAMAIDKRIYVETNFAELTAPKSSIYDDKYIKQSINIVLKKADEMGIDCDRKIDIKIKNELPIRSGLGSSGALSVALIKSLSSLLGLDLNKEDIAKMGWEVERNVQGFSSGLDPFVSTYGGIIYYKDGHFQRLNIDDTRLNFLIIHSGENSSTKEMVKKVARLKTQFPKIVSKIFDSIEEITEEAVSIFKSSICDEERLGHLMSINQGLLESLGVSTPKLSSLFYESLKSGALGAKITGSGGGGCLISLYPSEIDTFTNQGFVINESLIRTSIYKGLKYKGLKNGVKIEDLSRISDSWFTNQGL